MDGRRKARRHALYIGKVASARLPITPRRRHCAVANTQRMAGQLRDWSLVNLATDQQSRRASLRGLMADRPIPTTRSSTPPVGERASDCCYQHSNQSISATINRHGWRGLGLLLAFQSDPGTRPMAGHESHLTGLRGHRLWSLRNRKRNPIPAGAYCLRSSMSIDFVRPVLTYGASDSHVQP